MRTFFRGLFQGQIPLSRAMRYFRNPLFIIPMLTIPPLIQISNNRPKVQVLKPPLYIPAPEIHYKWSFSTLLRFFYLGVLYSPVLFLSFLIFIPQMRQIWVHLLCRTIEASGPTFIKVFFLFPSDFIIARAMGKFTL